MERGTMPFFAAMGAVVLVAGLFLSFYMSSHVYTTEGTKIILPKDSFGDSILVSGNFSEEQSEYKVLYPEINKDNIQKVIQTLKRPESYSAKVENQIFWKDGKQTLSINQYVKKGYCKTEFMPSDSPQIRHTILSKDSYYSWKTGDASYYLGNRGEFSFDTLGMVPTYETVLNLEKKDIIDAGLKNIDYNPCVYVTSKGSEKDVTYTYWISTITGLLVRADYFKEDTLVRQVNVMEILLNEPNDSYFMLPNNSLVFLQ